MATKKPKHLKSETVADSSYLPKRTMPGIREVVELKEESWFSIIRGAALNLFGFILLAALVIAFLYTALSATLMMYVPTGAGEERSLVVRNMWQDTGNVPPVGEEVVISTTTPLPAWYDLAVFGWTGIPEVTTVEIVSGPYDTITYDGDTVTNTVTAEEFTVPEGTSEDGTLQLNDQLLAMCVSGDCTPGEAFVISLNQIYGEAR